MNQLLSDQTVEKPKTKNIKTTCFWCGKTAEGTVEAEDPEDLYQEGHGYVTSYNPCLECLDRWGKGATTIIEVLDTEPLVQTPSIIEKDGKAYYPTGRLAVVTKEWVDGTLKAAVAKSFLESGVAFLGPDLFQQLFLNKDKD